MPVSPSTPAATAARDIAVARVRSAELDLSYCEVRAPIAGFTGRLARSEGSLVSPGADSLLTTVVQREQVWVRFGLSEQDFQRLFAVDAAAATAATAARASSSGTTRGDTLAHIPARSSHPFAYRPAGTAVGSASPTRFACASNARTSTFAGASDVTGTTTASRLRRWSRKMDFAKVIIFVSENWNCHRRPRYHLGPVLDDERGSSNKNYRG